MPAHEFYDFRLIPVRDVHFDGAAIEAMKPTGSRTTVAALAGVAGLILLIAGINFANLSAARSALRAREVALRKVVGARRRQILAQFLTEAAVLTAVAGLLALALVELSLPWISARLGAGAGLPPPSAWEVWAGPSLPRPAHRRRRGLLPLDGRLLDPPGRNLPPRRGGGGGSRVRALLVTLQFTISIALIVITLVMAMQTRFAGSMDLGFDAREHARRARPAGRGPGAAGAPLPRRDRAPAGGDLGRALLVGAVRPLRGQSHGRAAAGGAPGAARLPPRRRGFLRHLRGRGPLAGRLGSTRRLHRGGRRRA